jgi:hypothetical protein
MSILETNRITKTQAGLAIAYHNDEGPGGCIISDQWTPEKLRAIADHMEGKK